MQVEKRKTARVSNGRWRLLMCSAVMTDVHGLTSDGRKPVSPIKAFSNVLLPALIWPMMLTEGANALIFSMTRSIGSSTKLSAVSEKSSIAVSSVSIFSQNAFRNLNY